MVEGNWALAYMAFTVSRKADVQPWWATARQDLWEACGFVERPSYQATQLRFAELEEEELSCAFTAVAGELIQHARKHSNGQVGRDLHIDGTEAETNARLVHDCQPGENCQKRSKYPRRIHSDEAREHRHAEAAQPPPEDPDEMNFGDATEHLDLYRYQRMIVNGCWYRSLDKTAGIRGYEGKGKLMGQVIKFWHGFYT